MPATAEPPAIKVPKLKDLQAAPAAADTPPVTPLPSSTIVEQPAKADLPAPGEGEHTQQPFIDTSIIQNEPPKSNQPVGTAKSAEDFKRERLLQKETRASIEEVTRQYDLTKNELVQKGLEIEGLQKKLEQAEKERDAFKKSSGDREQDLLSLRTNYYEANRVTYNPAEDQEFITAQTTLLDTLRKNLPIRVPGKPAAGDDGAQAPTEVRVLFDAIMQQPGTHQGLANILDSYHLATSRGNEDGITIAVNAMAQLLGADVDVNPAAGQQPKLLKPSDPAFQKIEQALEQARPHHLARVDRYKTLQSEGPKLALQQFEQRSQKLRQTLAADVFMTPQQAAERLKQDPSDGAALMSQILQSVPALKERAEAELAEMTDAFAALSDRLQIPGLTSNNPAEIAAHREKEQKFRTVLATAMRAAVHGKMIGPILSNVMAERDAAEERATAASLLTSPGGSGRVGKEGQPPAPQIRTDIVTS